MKKSGMIWWHIPPAIFFAVAVLNYATGEVASGTVMLSLGIVFQMIAVQEIQKQKQSKSEDDEEDDTAF